VAAVLLVHVDEIPIVIRVDMQHPSRSEQEEGDRQGPQRPEQSERRHRICKVWLMTAIVNWILAPSNRQVSGSTHASMRPIQSPQRC
jgi:hypothetical protein